MVLCVILVCTTNCVQYTAPNCGKVTRLGMTAINVKHIDDKIQRQNSGIACYHSLRNCFVLQPKFPAGFFQPDL